MILGQNALSTGPKSAFKKSRVLVHIEGSLGAPEWLPRFPSLSFLMFLSKIPRNSSSLLDFAVRDIHNYFMEHSMRLDPKKC